MSPDQKFATFQKKFSSSKHVSNGLYYAKADNGKSKVKSFFVVYTADNYATGDTGTAYLVPQNPLSGSTEVVQSKDPIKSFQGFIVENPGIVVFQHFDYKGNGVQFQERANSIDEYFDYDQRDGVSSYIVTGGKWILCVEENLQGECIFANQGDLIPATVHNDRIRSLAPVKRFWTNETWAE